MADLHESRMFVEEAVRIAAGDEEAFVAVDIGQLRVAARGRGKAGIVGERAGLGIEFADIDDVGADGARQDRAVDDLVAQRDFRGVGPILFPVLTAGRDSGYAPAGKCCAASRRARLTSRPRSSSTSEIPGGTVRRVSAARNGCTISPSPRTEIGTAH